MTLDEAIKHCEENAKSLERQSELIEDEEARNDCIECAEEHEQLASWLKELKHYRELIKNL